MDRLGFSVLQTRNKQVARTKPEKNPTKNKGTTCNINISLVRKWTKPEQENSTTKWMCKNTWCLSNFTSQGYKGLKSLLEGSNPGAGEIRVGGSHTDASQTVRFSTHGKESPSAYLLLSGLCSGHLPRYTREHFSDHPEECWNTSLLLQDQNGCHD